MSDTATYRKTLAVIDGNSLMHRAFHAVPPNMTAPDGRHTNAVFGFLNMFLKMIDAFHPDMIACAFDKGRPQVRMDMLPSYKAQRPPMDPNLREQFPIIKDLLTQLHIPILEAQGWEGDDILGTAARIGEAAGFDVLLITGDRDMYQLSTDHVKIVGTKKGLSDVQIMTPDTVQDLYGGITPELVPDFYGLKGDSSDNIPGVPGIGPKKASALIMEYGSLDGVIAHADEVKGKMGENLRAHIDDALLSRKVATILTNAPVELDVHALEFPAFSASDVAEALGSVGINSMQNRFVALLGDDALSAASAPTLDMPHEWVRVDATSDESLALFAQAIMKSIATDAWLGLALDNPDTQDSLFVPARTLWIATTDTLFALEEAEGQLIGDSSKLPWDTQAGQVKGVLKLIFEQARVVSADLKELLHVIAPADSSLSASIDPISIDSSRMFDTTISAYLLDSSRTDFDDAYLCECYLHAAVPLAKEDEGAPKTALPRAAQSAVLSRILREKLYQAMSKAGALQVFTAIEMPLVCVLVDMERTGMSVDPKRLSEMSNKLAAQIAELDGSIRAMAEDDDFNISSPMQLSKILFDKMGLPTRGLKKTQRGYYSTNAKVLEELAAEHEFVRLILEYREKTKIKSTYLDTLGDLRRGDGRVHTTYNQTIAATGRLSSSKPNLQNIPTRSELGHTVKTAFAVGEGSVFVAVDYSQIELRLLAHLSGDTHLIAAFNEGEDFHAATAARVFGLDRDKVTSELRSRAKAVNFGIVYGQQAYGLSQTLGISQSEARMMIDRYFEAYPGVRAYLDETIAFARTHGFAETMFGRRRPIPDIQTRNAAKRMFAERTAMNHPMQGSAADIIKLAMIDVARCLRSGGFRARMMLQVHDELDFECPRDEFEALGAMVKERMENVVELKVPLIADISCGITWAEAK
ncbi:DNA polymerase I [Collinsella sp. zg1085]|uniref:DNA polymerase I n=1 Tax=Collinsella sp. zg1085 TaxID=2844380 RepID=UPI001C0B0042|nr:DNA polymerase I [Collinsella sp. zg1085]QWT17223.1 DNA polymerase I [Collinsella sp. zg1085]